jgi:hypothetical protein
MPYDNQYNQDIANTVYMNNRRFLEHLKMNNQNIEGSGIGNSASKCECRGMPCECQRGLGMCGGSGFAAGTAMDLGYEPTIGAGMSGAKTYRKRGCGQIASMPPPENMNEYPQQGAGMYNKTLDRKVGGKKAEKKGAGWNELKRDLASFDFNKVKDWVGLAKPPMEMKRLLNQVQLQRMPLKNKEKVVEKAQMQSVIGGGKSGAGESGAGTSGGKKHKGMGKSGAGESGAGTSGGGESGAGMSGGVDGRKKRAEIVKKVMKEKGMKMIEASKYVKANNLY